MATADRTLPALDETLAERPLPKLGRLESLLGPETYHILRGLVTNPLSITGILLISAFAVVALAAPLLAPVANARDPYQIPRDGFGPDPRPPGSIWNSRQPSLPFWWQSVYHSDKWVHILGTSSGQWDIWYGVIWGTRTAFRSGIIITLCTVMIGMIVGSLSAFYGSPLDDVLMRITEVFLAFPFLMAALVLAAIITPVVGKGELPAIIALTAFGWMSYARLIRGDILALKERDYITAAHAIGASDVYILLRHMIPNAVYPTLVLASLDIGTYVLNFAALSFLGVGTEIGHADWGQILSFARNYIPILSQYWYILVYPGMMVVLFVLGWNLVGDAVRDIMDPRLRGQRG